MLPSDSSLRRKVLLAALAGAGLLTLSLPAVHWQLGRPGLGLTVEPSGDVAVVGRVAEWGTAAGVGLSPGDTLLSVGNVRISGRVGETGGPVAALHQVVNDFREGERATWTVARGDDTREVTLPFAGIPESRVLSRIVVLGAFWLIAWFLLWARPDDRNARHLVYTIFALTASVLLIANQPMAVDTPLGFAVQQTHVLGLTFGPALVVHFGLVFPVSSFSDRAERLLLGATYGLYLVAVFAVQQGLFVRALVSPETPYLILPEALERLHYRAINVWLHVGNYLVAGGLMLWTYFRVEQTRVRDQIKWVLWAVLLTAVLDGFGMGAALYADAVTASDLYPHRNYLYLLIAAGLTIAIFRHDLFDVDRVIRGTVVYFGTVGSLFALFAATEALVSQALRELLPTRSGIAGTAAAAVLAGALFQPLRSWLREKMLDVLPVDPEEEVIGSG